MKLKQKVRGGAIHVAVAVGYAAAFAALWEVSFSHWLVFSGFRLCALLFVPRQFWLALAVGEFVPSAYNSLEYASEHGWLWAAVAAPPSIILAMPVIHWYGQHKKIFPRPGSVNMAALVSCMLLVSAIWTVRNLATIATIPLPANETSYPWIDLAARWFVGNFLGVLTVVPMAVWLKERADHASRGALLSTLAASKVLREGVVILVLALAFLVLVILASSNPSIQHIARVAMFLPVVWLAMYHGWPGAALGGMAASVAVIAVMPAWKDPSTLQAEVLVAFATTTMLLLGAHMAAQKDESYQEREERKLSQAAARRNLHAAEIQLRQMSADVDDLRESVMLNHRHLMAELRHAMPEMETHPYVRQAAAALERLQQLSEGLYPATWRHRGLPAALREGAIARALTELGVHYMCEIKGRGLLRLSSGVHIALYRSACEAIVLLCKGDNRVSTIRLQIRAGMYHGHRWVLLGIDGSLDGERDEGLYFGDLQRRLVTNSLGLDEIKLRASAFEGRAKQRPLLWGRRVSVFLRDPDL